MPFIINLKTNYSSFNIAIPFNMPESSLAASIPAYNDSLSCILRSISTARIYVSGYKSLLTSKNDKAACTNPSDVNLVSFFLQVVALRVVYHLPYLFVILIYEYKYPYK